MFLAEGASVVVSDIKRPPELDARAVFVHADVTDSAMVGKAVEACVSAFGGLDVAFAHAGIFGTVAPVEDYPEPVCSTPAPPNRRSPPHNKRLPGDGDRPAFAPGHRVLVTRRGRIACELRGSDVNEDRIVFECQFEGGS